jgi:tetratricopeptide (TPR) repeat protein
VVAQNLLNSTTNSINSTNVTAEILRTAEHHLLNALALDPQSLEVNELLGRFYINTHNPAKARARLMKTYPAKSENALLLAISYAQDNDASAAILWSGRAVAAFEQKLVQSAPKYSPDDRLDLVRALMIMGRYMPARETPAPAMPVSTNTAPQDSPAIWLGIVRALMTKGKYAAALETLEQQMLVSTNPVYSPAIAGVCAAWAGKISPVQKGGAAERLRLIQKGLTNAPENLQLQLLLVQTTHAAGDTGLAAKKLLDQLMAGAAGESAAWWHFLLWTDDRIRGDLATGRRHLQTAYELAPQIPQIKNDLAMDLSTGSQDDLERSLKLIQPVVDQFPNAPGFRDTRGRILARLGQNKAAAADLEFAIPKLADPAEARLILAKVYDALGIPQYNPSDRLGRARALMNEGKYAAALETLEQGTLVSTNPAFSPVIADICAAWVEKIPPGQKGGSAERLRLIQKGLNHAPEHQKLRSLLVQAAQASDDSGLAAKNLLDQSVADTAGVSAAEWHLFLGRDARMKGDLATARRHLQTANELAPQLTQIKHELALVLSAGNREDLEQGLELIQLVVDQFPDSPEFRNTRGRILARLGQNKAAAVDLEFAAAKLANPAETRLMLAKAYDALGKTQLAEQQRRLAETAGKPPSP